MCLINFSMSFSVHQCRSTKMSMSLWAARILFRNTTDKVPCNETYGKLCFVICFVCKVHGNFHVPCHMFHCKVLGNFHVPCHMFYRKVHGNFYVPCRMFHRKVHGNFHVPCHMFHCKVHGNFHAINFATWSDFLATFNLFFRNLTSLNLLLTTFGKNFIKLADYCRKNSILEYPVCF